MRLAADWLGEAAPRRVMALLSDAGHRAYFVGGCVRDALIGAPATDLDLATDARPQAVMALAEAAGVKAVPTGIDHGTVTLVLDGRPFEVTTFRRDLQTDGRRATVAFSDRLEDDAARRDFTINALYADAAGDVVDPVGGLADLAARRVRFIGTPEDRIREDYLRILRFFRFHAWYADPSGGIDAEGLAACAALADGVDGLSRERVGAEMAKLLAAPDPAPATAAMAACGVLGRLLPGADAAALAPLVHAESRLGLAPDPILRLAALGGGAAAERLRLSRADARRLRTLAEAARSGQGAGALGYRLGAAEGRAALALAAALEGRDIEPAEADAVASGARQRFPLAAADLMPALSGPALGSRLAALEAEWIASGFQKDRDALLRAADDRQVTGSRNSSKRRP